MFSLWYATEGLRTLEEYNSKRSVSIHFHVDAVITRCLRGKSTVVLTLARLNWHVVRDSTVNLVPNRSAELLCALDVIFAVQMSNGLYTCSILCLASM